jgi:hypothetical protein
MHVEVVPASYELETRPDVTGYTSEWLGREERDLLSFADSATFPDERARRRYVDKLAVYRRQLESAIYDRTDRLLPLRRITPFRVSVHNLGDHTLQGVQLTIELHAHGQQQLIQADLDEALLTELPFRPTPPGQQQTSTPEQQRREAHLRSRRLQRQVELSELAWQSPHSADHGLQNIVRPAAIIATQRGDRLIELVYPQFTLRAQHIFQLPNVALDLFESLDTKCEVLWSATAINQPGVLRGQFQLITVAQPYALARTWPRDGPTASSATAGRGSDAGLGLGPDLGSECDVAACGIIGHVNPMLLAASGELPSTKLRLRLQAAAQEIRDLDDDALDDPQAIVDTLIAKYSVPITVYRGQPTIIGEPRDHRLPVGDWPHPTQMVSKAVRDYTVAVDFDGDAELVRASFATCSHEPLWRVRGNQIRTVFTVDRAMPGADLERKIREHAAHAVEHLEQTRDDTGRFHEDLNALIEDMIPKMVAVRLAGQRQRQELNLPFVELSGHEPTPTQQADEDPVPAAVPADTNPNVLFQEVIAVLQAAVTELSTNTPLTLALYTEDLMRSLLVIYLKGRLPSPYLFTEETFHGQGKVDISIHWNQILVGIIECKVWHSKTKFKNGIDQVLSYLTYGDTQVAYVVFIRKQNVTKVVNALKQTMYSHDNCADGELPPGRDRIDFHYHATADVEQTITMVLLPMPLTTSATGTSVTRGLNAQLREPRRPSRHTTGTIR